MTDPGQPRQSNGQWTGYTHTDPGQLDLVNGRLNLWEEDGGTFEFPYFARNAQEVVDFWSRVEIPEEVLVATTVAYNQRRLNDMAKLANKYRVTHRLPVDAKKFAEYEAAAAKWVEEQIREQDKIYPAEIHPPAVRAVVRAAKMSEAAKVLPEDQQALVRDLKVRVPGGWQMTIGQIRRQYRTDELLPAMIDMARRDAVSALVRRDIAIDQRATV